MREYIALEVVKAQQKRAVIDEFIDSLNIPDATFRETLKEYLYPHLVGTLFKKDYYERGEHEVVVLTPFHRFGVEMRRYYNPIREKLVTLITGTTASELSWLQIVTAMIKEFAAFKAAYNELRETHTNNKELWLQYIRFEILRYYFSDVVTYKEGNCNPTMQDYEETILALEPLLEPYGVSIDMRRKKRYGLNTLDGAVSYIDDMIVYLNVALPFIYDGLKENKFRLYQPFITELDLYEYTCAKTFDFVVAREFYDALINVDNLERLCLSNNEYALTLKQITDYIRIHITDEKYCNLICRYVEDAHPFEAYSDRLLFYYQEDNEIKCDELIQEFAAYIANSYFSDTTIEQITQLYNIVIREFNAFKDVFTCYKNGTATTIELFLRYIRYNVVADHLDTIMLRHVDYEVFETPSVNCLDVTTFTFNLDAKEDCIANIEADIEYLKLVHSSIYEAITTNNQPLMYTDACKLGIIALNLYNPVLKLCDRH